MIKNMLVAIDGSPKSFEAFDFALDMAAACNAAPLIHLLAVVQPPESLYLVETDSLVDSASKQFEAVLKGLAEKAKAKNIAVRTVVTVGHPAERIVKFAGEKNCDLIVVGHTGKSMLGGLLLGSVSRRVAAEAPCSVVIVK
ncbi:MAG: universal stress protein [Actinomycetota bacterium]|nr:universal stress protein [Actinomycetota bacterium]